MKLSDNPELFSQKLKISENQLDVTCAASEDNYFMALGKLIHEAQQFTPYIGDSTYSKGKHYWEVLVQHAIIGMAPQ